MVVANFTDGTSTSSGSDLEWKARNGPITYDHLWHGEIYDANREIEDWASAPVSDLQNQLTVDGSDPGWKSVVPMHPLVGTLSPQVMPPIRIVQSFEPVSINTVEQGEFEAGCTNGFDGGRFIRCPSCKGPAGKGVGGDLLSAVFFQSCSNELTHLTAAEADPSPCGLHVSIELVEPSVLSGWESRYKGPVVCSALPRNNTQTLTVVDFGASPSTPGFAPHTTMPKQSSFEVLKRPGSRTLAWQFAGQNMAGESCGPVHIGNVNMHRVQAQTVPPEHLRVVICRIHYAEAQRQQGHDDHARAHRKSWCGTARGAAQHVLSRRRCNEDEKRRQGRHRQGSFWGSCCYDVWHDRF